MAVDLRSRCAPAERSVYVLVNESEKADANRKRCEMINRSSGDVVSMESLEPKTPEWIWPGYIVRSGINLIVGAKGVGKTSFACWLAARASRGDALVSARPLRVYIDSLEDDPEVVLRPRLEAAEAAMGMIETRRPGRAGWKFPRDINALDCYLEDREQRSLSVDLVVLDSLSAYLPRFTTPEQADETLETLTRVCERYRCGVVFVHHLQQERAHNRLGHRRGRRCYAELPQRLCVRGGAAAAARPLS